MQPTPIRGVDTSLTQPGETHSNESIQSEKKNYRSQSEEQSNGVSARGIQNDGIFEDGLHANTQHAFEIQIS